MDIFDIVRRYKFHVYNEHDDEVCTINYQWGVGIEDANVEIKNPEDLPVDIWFGDKSTEALLIFLEGRVLPPNRMFLDEELKPLGIDPNDWLSKIQLNQGRTYDDEYYVITEVLEDGN